MLSKAGDPTPSSASAPQATSSPSTSSPFVGQQQQQEEEEEDGFVYHEDDFVDGAASDEGIEMEEGGHEAGEDEDDGDLEDFGFRWPRAKGQNVITET